MKQPIRWFPLFPVAILFLLSLNPVAGAHEDDDGGYSSTPSSRRGFAVGLGPIGNIYLIDTRPVLDPGIGGHFFMDYRFHSNVAFETSFFIANQDGDDVDSAERNILLLGMPTFNLKYYFLNHDRWDPFFSTGVGLYFLTEGTVENDKGGVGFGSQLGIGFDYYLARLISLGFTGTFRSVAVITNFKTPSDSTAIFPYSLEGNIAFHF